MEQTRASRRYLIRHISVREAGTIPAPAKCSTVDYFSLMNVRVLLLSSFSASLAPAHLVHGNIKCQKNDEKFLERGERRRSGSARTMCLSGRSRDFSVSQANSGNHSPLAMKTTATARIKRGRRLAALFYFRTKTQTFFLPRLRSATLL